MTAPTSHARLNPSGSSRWLACPFSARDYPETEAGQAALDGREIHESAAFSLTVGLPLFGADKLAAPYVEFVAGLDGEKHIEQRIDSAIVDEFGGTLDCVAVTDDSLHVVDFKSGKWVVRAKDNPQLKCYLCLAREKFPDRVHFAVTVVQPKAFKRPQTAVVTDRELNEHIAKVAIAADSSHKAAGDWCRFCALRPNCTEGQYYAAGQGWPK